MIIDAHTHIFSSDLQRYPLADPQASYRPSADGSVELLRRQMDEAGVDRAVTIPPAFCGWDARYALDALAEHGTWLAVAVLIDPLDSTSPQRLEQYVHDYGVCGLRLQRRIPRQWEFEDEASTPLWAKAEELGITLDVNATHEEYPAVERRIRQFPHLRMVLDHCGYVSAELGPRTPTVEPVIRLAHYPNVYAKLSFFGIANEEPYPFPSLHWMARQLIDAFGAERCLYGSNFPTEQYNQKMSYAQTVQLFSEAIELSPAERRWLLGGTAERLWRWGQLPADVRQASPED